MLYLDIYFNIIIKKRIYFDAATLKKKKIDKANEIKLL